MKKYLKPCIFSVIALILIALLPLAISAEDADSVYIIERSSAGYVANSMEYDTLSSLIASLEEDGVKFIFNGITVSESINVTKKVTFSGQLSLDNGGITINGGAVFNELSLELCGAGIRLKGGATRVIGSTVNACGTSAFVLDHAASATLIIDNSEVLSAASDATVKNYQGTVEIISSRVENEYGFAIDNRATLALGGNSAIEGYRHSIKTGVPIRLTACGEKFTEPLSVVYDKTFEKGAFEEVLLLANEEEMQNISLFDSSLTSIPITYFDESEYSEEKGFIAVYMPYRVKFYSDGVVIKTEELLKDEALYIKEHPERTGYSFEGYYRDASFTEPFVSGDAPNADISLYADFNLNAPSFKISSLDFVYDGELRYLEFDELYHELDGSYSFDWYKNGEQLNEIGKSVGLREASDSGEYTCKITFSYGGDFTETVTPGISVSISKKTIEKPSDVTLVYTGTKLPLEIPESEYYEVINTEVIHAGKYPVTLLLKDPENTKWADRDTELTTVNVTVLPAENKFLSLPGIIYGYEGVSPSVDASALFGDIEYLYSEDGEIWQVGLPTESGSYKVKLTVRGTDDYSSLESEPISTEIASEIPIGIKLSAQPSRTDYFAFEEVSLDGAVFLVTYNSGRTDTVSADAVSISYKSHNSVRVGDSCVIVSFGNASVPVPIRVSPIDYDISGLIFEDRSVIYNAASHSICVDGEVIGQDGLPLVCSVSGAGVDVGAYRIVLSFSSESVNYNVPDSIERTLTVLPMPLDVQFENLTFVYDGEAKKPTASAITATGLVLYLDVVGAATDAGVYTASASIKDKNYTLTEPFTQFEILKAELDFSGVSWSDGGLLYNGELQSVRVENLPFGVSVVGYADASYTEVGKYTAKATITFDEKNYKGASMLSYDWQILPIEYDFSECRFVDTSVVYDGAPHYPSLIGSLPIGFDGSTPECSFSRGAMHVGDGKVLVTVSFTSNSKNYLTPAPVSAYVSVLPKEIEVVWQSLSFVYDGKCHTPSVSDAECEIYVSGGGTDAGEYIAEAYTDNTDYKLVGAKALFRIEKANNAWVRSPGIYNYYTSGKANPFGEAVFGEVQFTYYSDIELTMPVAYPSDAADYYMVAFVEESANYLPLISEPVPFSVVAVAPIKFEVKLNSESYVAFTRITLADFVAYYVNNDGTRTLLSQENVDIIYENADSLRYADKSVTFRIGVFEYTAQISVTKATYDMSSAHWENEYHVYDGEEKRAYLEGLPDGVTLLAYELNSAINAGSYRLSAVLDYDRENYYPPKVPESWLIIEKCKIRPYIPGSVEYDNRYHTPLIEENPLYSVSSAGGVSAGKYTVTFTLKDSANYEFESGVNTAVFEIAPRYVTVRINDDGKSYTVISGSIVEGDDIGARFYKKDGYVCMEAENSNYRVTVVPLKEKSYLPLILILILALLLLSLAVYIVISRRKDIVVLIEAAREKIKKSPTENAGSKESACLETLLTVDESYANALISDSLAKSFVGDEKITVETSGSARAIINIDTVSDAFSAGDTVDINAMKERGLIPRDASFVKVLARGVIDKPLTVIANSFSIAAVKMIALTGGTVKRAKTQKIKNKRKEAAN